MNEERDRTVVRAAVKPDDPDATVRKPLWALWRRPARAATPARDTTTVVLPREDTGATDAAAESAERSDDSDATVIRNTVVRTTEATRVEADRTQPRLTTLRPLPKRSLALPKGLQLNEYRIERVLGQGGFGITYLATDINLDAKVAIKEYLPEEIAFRASDRSVSPHASEHRDRYRQGLDNFLTEARTLASFRHPNIVRVARFFEAHSTAYMVLEYERGRSFKSWWNRQQPDSAAVGTAPSAQGERLLVQRLQPLLDGLSAVHRSGYLHRDIKPDNIQVRAQDGRMVLLDFGSAGQTVALADQDAVVVTPGYAPIEQYGVGEQGAWTDLYALGATLYWAVAGRKPPDAETRALGISLQAAVEVGKGRFSRNFLEAIDWALQMDATLRPQSVDAWRQRLLADHLASPGRPEPVDDDEDPLPDEGTLSKRSARHSSRRLRQPTGWLQPSAWPLGRRLGALLLMAALLPLLLSAGLLVAGVGQTARQAQLQQAEAAAVAGASRLGRLLLSASGSARALAVDADVVTGLSTGTLAESWGSRLQALQRFNADIDAVLVLDGSGQVRLSTAPPLHGAALGPVTSGMSLAPAPDGTTVLVSEPVRDGAGKPLGAVALRLRSTAVAAALASGHSGMTPVLVDALGQVVHHPQADQRQRPLQPAALAAALQAQRAAGQLRWQSQAGEQQIAGYAPVPGQRWTVFMLSAETAPPPPAKQLGLLLLGALGAAALAGWQAHRLARRFTLTADTLRQREQERASRR